MARYLDPRIDIIFKRIFGEHPDMLISFLNAVMPFSAKQKIKHIEYLPAEQVPINPDDRDSTVDVKCRDRSGRVFIIEMQMLWNKNFMKRIVFNAGKAYVKQLAKGDDYMLLQPVYTLSILNTNFDKKTGKFFHHYKIVNIENSDEVIHDLQFVLIELLKFKPKTWSRRKVAVLWLRFLKEVNESMRALPPEMAENELIRQAAELCEEAAFTPGELEKYEQRKDAIRSVNTLIEGGRQEGLAEGLKKGMAEGEAIGLEKGEAIGLEKGEAIVLEKGEAQAMIKVVQNSRAKGLSIEAIAAITGFTEDKITEIIKHKP
jgi:predicted transposase/invertase (TIGR01784 family)